MFDNRGSPLKIRFLKPGEYHEFKSCTLVCMPNLKFKSWKLHTVHIIARQSSWNSGYMTACANLKNPSKWVSLYPNLGYNDHTHAQGNIFITWISDFSFEFRQILHTVKLVSTSDTKESTCNKRAYRLCSLCSSTAADANTACGPVQLQIKLVHS